MLLARLVGETKRIRLGAGGMMLPNFPPLVVAEQFGLLASMAPGRIDLGVGRAPGTDMSTRRHFVVPTAQEAESYDYHSTESMIPGMRSEERRVRKECVSKCSYR